MAFKIGERVRRWTPAGFVSSPAFLALWLVQTLSLLGSQLTGFAFSVALFQTTGSTSVAGLLNAATMVPQLLFAPFAGVLVDRAGARRALLLGHAGAGACTLALMLTTQRGVDLPTTLLLVTMASCMRAAEYPGFQAATTLLVPVKHRGRANGLVQLSFGLPLLVGPVVAARLMSTASVPTILAIDAGSFVVALSVIATLRIPRVDRTGATATVRSELASALRFIVDRRGLLGLLLCFFVLNFNLGVVQVLLTPLVLGYSDAKTLGSVLSTGGMGMLVGALLMTAWGGPRRRIVGVLGAALGQGAFFCLGAARPSTPLIALGAFGALAMVPLMAACNITIWQRKVPLDAQGRVAALRSMLAIGAMPVGFLVAGPLADGVFEPSMRAGTWLAGILGPWIGVGAGRGAAVMFGLLGLLTMLSAVVAFANPTIRRVEEELPDRDGW